MSKHTPGPWYVQGHEIKVLQPHREFLGDGGPETICEMLSSVSPEATECNARLIAAAPELLTALCRIQAALACVRDDVPDKDPVYGRIALEDVKYLIVDPAINEALGEV